MTREEAFERITHSYEAYYDIETVEIPENEIPLVAKYSFYLHSEKYVLLKKAKLWSADSNEYVYVFSVPTLTKEIYEECRDYAYDEGMKRINPKPGHMCSYITALFLCDRCEKDAKKALKACRLHKNFQLSLLGWMDYHTALVELQTEQICTNGSGRANAKALKSIIHVTKTKN